MLGRLPSARCSTCRVLHLGCPSSQCSSWSMRCSGCGRSGSIPQGCLFCWFSSTSTRCCSCSTSVGSCPFFRWLPPKHPAGEGQVWGILVSKGAIQVKNNADLENTMIFKNLWRRKTRSFLTILGIAIGVAAVVGLGAMAQGMMKNYGSVVGLSNDLLVSQANAFDVAFSSLDAELEQRLLAVPGVEEVDPGVYGWIVTEEMPYFLVFGYHPGSIAMGHYRIVEGKPVTGPKQIALGRRAADSLKKKIDDTLRIYGVPYQIVGIYETGQALEESGGTVALEDAQTITQKIRKVSLFQVGVRRGTDLDQVIQRLEALENDLTVSKSSEYQASQDWSQYLQGFAWGVAAIAILIGGLGMMNAMVMSVLERTREIGTLRAVGWSRNRVVALILGETVALSLLGGLVGIGMGVGFTELAARAPGIGGMLEGAYSAGIFVQGLVTALGLGVVGGAYPAWVAANLQPVEALRYEGGGTGEVKGRLARVGNQSFRNLWRRR
ncbi:MAG: hypothetical protein CVU38_06500, partial [Chloroflexi bacterium HGW-Chloroflexi-1]